MQSDVLIDIGVTLKWANRSQTIQGQPFTLIDLFRSYCHLLGENDQRPVWDCSSTSVWPDL